MLAQLCLSNIAGETILSALCVADLSHEYKCLVLAVDRRENVEDSLNTRSLEHETVG